MQTSPPRDLPSGSPVPSPGHPADAAAWIARGDGLCDLASFYEAIDCYRHALAQEPGSGKALLNLGYAMQALSRPEEALACYEQVIARDPRNIRALANKSVALLALNRPGEAMESYAAALAVDPENPESHFNLGYAFQELGRHAEALTRYERAISIRPAYAEALSNRGMTLQALGRHAEALESYDRALAAAPDSIEAHTNRGAVLQDLGRYDEALSAYVRAQQIQPDYPDAHWNEALCRLKLAELPAGWRKYEWRWQTSQRGQRRDFEQPLWLGDTPLEGKTILLHAEQGIGDTLQFCRYAAGVAALGARVVLEVQRPLTKLLTGLEGVRVLLAHGDALPPFDCHCPLLSLPLAFATRLETIPSAPAYLRADPVRVAHWRNVLGPQEGPRVGLAWSGREDQADDRNRSIPLAQLLPLAATGARLVGLQKDVRPRDRAVLDRHRDILHFGEDFADTAALVELMDVVVSVDTSIAHLAGALGRPVWLLLPRNPDWRWMLERGDSPWYPSARLFRQRSHGQWTPVIDEVARALAGLAVARRP